MIGAAEASGLASGEVDQDILQQLGPMRIRPDDYGRATYMPERSHALASPAPHGDHSAGEIKWDREKALVVIAGVAALVACGDQQTAGPST